MDRHDFVRRLIEERDGLKAEYGKLSEEKAYFEKKTLEYLLGLMKVDKCDMYDCTYTYTTLNDDSWVSSVDILGEESRVTDGDIKKLSHQIVELGDKITTIKPEIAKLKKEDFRPQLKEFLNTNPKFDDE